MKAEISEYEQQAQDFLSKTGTTFEAVFSKYGKHFDTDTDKRDIYEITLKRGNREFKFKFGQSLNCSMEWTANTVYSKNAWIKSGQPRLMGTKKDACNLIGLSSYTIMDHDLVKNKDFKAPTAYDVLACLTKYDPGTLEEFCSEFGYDADSKRAEKLYNAVVNEWHNVAMLWNDAEIEDLTEIQ